MQKVVVMAGKHKRNLIAYCCSSFASEHRCSCLLRKCTVFFERFWNQMLKQVTCCETKAKARILCHQNESRDTGRFDHLNLQVSTNFQTMVARQKTPKHTSRNNSKKFASSFEEDLWRQIWKAMST